VSAPEIVGHDETQPPITAAKITTAKTAFLFILFLLIASGFGYPVLNRFDPREMPALSDVKSYAAVVTGTANSDPSYRRFRVLVPWIARPVYRLAQGRLGSWDPVMFSLLVSDSIFVAATAVLIVLVGIRHLGNAAVGLLGAFLYLANFAIPNLRVVGLVDAGEGFFMLALLWSLAEARLWLLPLIAVLGTLTKESFIPYILAFTAVWWLSSRSGRNRAKPSFDASAAWIVASWAATVAAFVVLHRAIEGTFTSPIAFGLGLHQNQNYLAHFAESLTDRMLWYTFLWLLPTAIPNLRRFPRSWLLPIAATCLTAFALDAFHGPAPAGAMGRALFTIAGPVLSLSSALLLIGMF